MFRKLTDQNGFSVVESVLLLVIVAMLGFTGWYVWHARQNADTTLSADNSTVPTFNKKSQSNTSNDTTSQSQSQSLTLKPSAPPPVSTYNGWKSYKTSYGVSFKYPADWHVETCGTESTGVIAVASIVNSTSCKRGTQADMPQYNNDLVLTLASFKPEKANTFAPLDQYASLVQGNISINGSAYCLVGQHSSSIKGNPITVISADACQNNAYLNNFPIKNGLLLDAEIDSAGNGGASTVGITLSNPQLTILKNVLSSIRF